MPLNYGRLSYRSMMCDFPSSLHGWHHLLIHMQWHVKTHNTVAQRLSARLSIITLLGIAFVRWPMSALQAYFEEGLVDNMVTPSWQISSCGYRALIENQRHRRRMNGWVNVTFDLISSNERAGAIELMVDDTPCPATIEHDVRAQDGINGKPL